MSAKIRYLLVPVTFVFAMVASLALGQGLVAAQGIGVYPTQLLFQDAARGGEYFRTVGVINSGDSDTLFTLEGEGPISQWITFVNVNDRANVIEDVTVPGNSERQTLLRITVPGDAANGEYRGLAKVVARAGAAQAGGASVGVGAAIDVSITVTGEQQFDGSLEDSSIGDVEVGSPLRVRAVVRNSGNVRFTPQVTLEVLDSDTNVVAQETFLPETVVFPNEAGQLDNELDVPGLGEGEYVARVSARAGDLDLGSRESSFSVLPVGTLTRQGELGNMALEIVPAPGDLGKLEIVFRNTGQIDTLAKFVGELYRQDRVLEVLSSEELLVPVREQKTLELFFRVDEPGEYLIKGKVNYQGKETEIKELTFTVTQEGPAEAAAGPVVAPGPSDSVGSGGSATAASEQTETTPPVWEMVSSAAQEIPFNSPLGALVIALGFLVVLLLIILVSRRATGR